MNRTKGILTAGVVATLLVGLLAGCSLPFGSANSTDKAVAAALKAASPKVESASPSGTSIVQGGVATATYYQIVVYWLDTAMTSGELDTLLRAIYSSMPRDYPHDIYLGAVTADPNDPLGTDVSLGEPAREMSLPGLEIVGDGSVDLRFTVGDLRSWYGTP